MISKHKIYGWIKYLINKNSLWDKDILDPCLRDCFSLEKLVFARKISTIVLFVYIRV